MEKIRNWKQDFYTIWAGQAVSLITSGVLQMAIRQSVPLPRPLPAGERRPAEGGGPGRDPDDPGPVLIFPKTDR